MPHVLAALVVVGASAVAAGGVAMHGELADLSRDVEKLYAVELELADLRARHRAHRARLEDLAEEAHRNRELRARLEPAPRHAE